MIATTSHPTTLAYRSLGCLLVAMVVYGAATAPAQAQSSGWGYAWHNGKCYKTKITHVFYSREHIPNPPWWQNATNGQCRMAGEKQDLNRQVRRDGGGGGVVKSDRIRTLPTDNRNQKGKTTAEPKTENGRIFDRWGKTTTTGQNAGTQQLPSRRAFPSTATTRSGSNGMTR